MSFEVVIDPDGSFQATVREALKRTGDLRLPFALITQSWFKSNRAIFALKGPGKYQDLSPGYKKQKQKAVGFIYPILKRTGLLADSITVPGHPDGISTTVNKTTLNLGTKVKYGIFHQSALPRTRIPFRPFVLLGPEQVAPSEINRRREAWIKILQDYVLQKTGETLGPVTGV